MKAEEQELIRIINYIEDMERTCDDENFDLIKSIVEDLWTLFTLMYPDPEDQKEQK